MFCSNCGIEVTGKFCSNCGKPVDSDSNAVEKSAQPENSDVIVLNGVRIDMKEVFDTYGNNRIGACKYVADISHSNSEQAKKVTNDYFDKHTKPKGTIWERAKAQAAEQQMQKMKEKKLEKQRLADMDRQRIPYCPKCHSASISANKKGFGIGKAVIGATISPIGLVAGNIGAKKVRLTCMNCGHQWMAGKK